MPAKGEAWPGEIALHAMAGAWQAIDQPTAPERDWKNAYRGFEPGLSALRPVIDGTEGLHGEHRGFTNKSSGHESERGEAKPASLQSEYSQRQRKNHRQIGERQAHTVERTQAQQAGEPDPRSACRAGVELMPPKPRQREPRDHVKQRIDLQDPPRPTASEKMRGEWQQYAAGSVGRLVQRGFQSGRSHIGCDRELGVKLPIVTRTWNNRQWQCLYLGQTRCLEVAAETNQRGKTGGVAPPRRDSGQHEQHDRHTKPEEQPRACGAMR